MLEAEEGYSDEHVHGLDPVMCYVSDAVLGLYDAVQFHPSHGTRQEFLQIIGALEDFICTKHFSIDLIDDDQVIIDVVDSNERQPGNASFFRHPENEVTLLINPTLINLVPIEVLHAKLIAAGVLISFAGNVRVRQNPELIEFMQRRYIREYKHCAANCLAQCLGLN